VVVPLLVAAVVATFSWALPRRVVEVVSIATAVATTAMCAALLVRSADHPIVYWYSGWHPKHGVVLGISFTVDALGAGTGLLSGVLATAALVFATAYVEGSVEHRFDILMLVFLAAMVAFGLTGDLFDMFVFFELMSVAAFALTGYEVYRTGPLQGSINFAIVVSFGSFCLLLGIALVYARTGALNLAAIGAGLAGRPADGLVVVAFTLLAAGLFVKAGVVPFHFWVADAYAVAPVPVGMLFGGVMTELGLYGIARIYWTAFSGTLSRAGDRVGNALVALGVVTAVVGAVMAFAQQHVKRLLAFSCVAHIGLFLVGLGILAPDALAGVALSVLGHGLVTGGLFLLTGVLIYRLGGVDEEELRGRGRVLKATGALFALGGLALAAVPPLGMFTGKALVEDSAVTEGLSWVPWLFAAVAAVTGGAVLRATARIFLGWGPRERDVFASDIEGEQQGPGELHADRPDRTPIRLMAPAALLLVAGLAVGPAVGLVGPTERASLLFQDRAAYARRVLHGAEPAVRRVPVGKPSASSVWFGLGSGAGAAGLAAVALFRRRLLSPSARRRLRTALRPPVRALRRLHSGHAGDYAAWFAVGVAALGGLFALAVR
jgi:multicomponent Na+:H+ antiporter subunit D